MIHDSAARFNAPQREVELKFLVDEAGFKQALLEPALGAVAKKAPFRRLRSVYFDTEAGDLRRNLVVLRLRARRGGHVMTLKWSESTTIGPFERGEIEVFCRGETPDLSLLGEEIAAELHRLTEGRPLHAAYSTEIRRATHLVAVGDSQIEVAFDVGKVVAGDRSAPLREIEMELKSGEPADLHRLGLVLLGLVPVRLGVQTKSERGVLLASGAAPQAVRARSTLRAGMPLDAAIAAVLGGCLQQFIANWPAFYAASGVEAVHQMRVSMRRLRAALALFQRAFPTPEFTAFRAEAKRIASAMGDARNWDVFTQMVHDGPLPSWPAEPGFQTMLLEASKMRDDGYSAVNAILADPVTTRFVLALQAFIAHAGWRNAVGAAELAQLTEPATGFAAHALDRLHRRVRKRGRKLLELEPIQRHDVRIALKNLRYAADFFGDLFDRPAVIKRYARAAADLQEALGGYNDVVMVGTLVTELDGGHDPALSRAAGIMIGWHGRGALDEEATLGKVWRDFREARPFWQRHLPPRPAAPDSLVQ